jgi:hypothetical protein
MVASLRQWSARAEPLREVIRADGKNSNMAAV